MFIRFNPGLYFSIKHDYKIDSPYLSLSSEGAELIAQYYAAKYAAQIIFCKDVLDFKRALNNFLHKNKGVLPKDYRQAFIIGGHTTHAMPIIYIRENNQEAFLCADSLGTQIRFIEPNIITAGINKKIAQMIKQDTQIKTFIITEQRQADLYSCFIDALIFARDCVGIDSHTQTFLCGNLLQNLEAGASLSRGDYEVKLPDVLLKTCQLSGFRQKHRESKPGLITRTETLDEFNTRYSKQQHSKIIHHYLQQKSLKFAQIIEIQFYINQLTQLLLEAFTPALKKLFTQEAKRWLCLQGEVFLNVRRCGLYDFVEDFYKNNLLKTSAKYESQVVGSHRFFSPKKTMIEKAELLLTIITDASYWRSKAYFALPTGISLMHDELTQLADISLAGKIHALRDIAQAQNNPTKGFLYLFLGLNIDFDEPIVKDLYKLFEEDWQSSLLFKKIYDDWCLFNHKPLEADSWHVAVK